MPAQNLDHVKKTEATIAKKIAAAGKDAEAPVLRGLKKKLRRAQRKRRRLATEAARTAPAAKPTAEPAKEAAAE
jgi:hypothetical protein